ncbi:hypothetical protein DF3PA_60146 [Candidatus Defluviicoccus seviourii]|uniref:UspA domain-containing protein n=1 Tax=Candidatus Defluviicoccus seviourii TaxID=2565273 RepID=A0A564WGS6_9PROT|nr:hypothetical protein DF3PA_60146 [Candidatus Defluviicoccus seviourii]
MSAPPAGGDPEVRRRFRRVVVAFDWGSENAGAVELVAALAERLRAELKAMFVEDIDLMRLAEHPHVFAFSALSATGQQLAADHLRRVLRSRLARSREAIEAAAERRQLKYAFEVRQGRLLAEALKAAESEDLVILSWTAGGGTTSFGPGQAPPVVIAQALAEAHARSVLLLHPEAPAGGSLVLAYDGSAGADAALLAALEVADEDGGAIEVALLSGRTAEVERWAETIRQTLADYPARGGRFRARLIAFPGDGLEGVCRTAARLGASLIVLGADLALAQHDTGRRALERVGCSVLLVR